MLERLEQRGQALAGRRAERRRARIAADLSALPGVATTVDAEQVVLSGPALSKRHARSADLRWDISEACDER